MPDYSTEEDLLSLFDNSREGIQSIHKELEDVWYVLHSSIMNRFVTFYHEEDALYYNQQLQNYQYNNSLLKVRLKSENLYKYLNPTLFDRTKENGYSMISSSDHDLSESLSTIPSVTPNNFTSFSSPIAPYYYYYQNGIDPSMYLPPYYHKSRGAKRRSSLSYFFSSLSWWNRSPSQDNSTTEESEHSPTITTTTTTTSSKLQPSMSSSSFSKENHTKPMNVNTSIPLPCYNEQQTFGYQKPFIKYTSCEIYDIVSVYKEDQWE